MYVIAQILNSLWSLWLPEGTPRHLLVACRVLAPLTFILWVLTIANIWVNWRPAAMSAARAGAAVTIVIAFMCWLVAIRIHDDRRRDAAPRREDEDWRHLRHAAEDAIRRLPEDQRRELLVRQVSAR